jgi:hypothetical protein
LSLDPLTGKQATRFSGQTLQTAFFKSPVPKIGEFENRLKNSFKPQWKLYINPTGYSALAFDAGSFP